MRAWSIDQSQSGKRIFLMCFIVRYSSVKDCKEDSGAFTFLLFGRFCDTFLEP